MFIQLSRMLCIENPYTDPYFNLAAEEYFFKSSAENVFMLWQNAPCVVIGKHQDVAKEVNYPLARKKQIRLARRLTGGGAVYHDGGNFNLSLIGERGMVCAAQLTEMLCNFLLSLGIAAHADGRKNIRIGGFKVSGSAQSVYKNRWLFHATLLFSSDLETLAAVLQPAPEVRPAPGVVSVDSERSPVANVSEYLPGYITYSAFRTRLWEYVFSSFFQPVRAIFTPKDIAAITWLKENKYRTDLWTYRIASAAFLPSGGIGCNAFPRYEEKREEAQA